MSNKKPKSCWRQYFEIKSGGIAKCKYCPKEIKTCSNTTNLKQHMERKHFAIVIANQEQHVLSELDTNVLTKDTVDSLKLSPPASGTRSPPVTSVPKRTKTNIEASFSRILEHSSDGNKTRQITQAIIEMICRDSLPYSIVEGEGFKKLMKLLAPLYKVPCRKTVTDIIDKKYEEKKALVVRKLQSVNNLCLTVDEWKDLQMRSFLGVTLHFVENFEVVSFNIACEPLTENHTADYLSSVLNKICSEWDIGEDKIVSINTDNGANIVKTVEVTYGRAKHIRCVAHTLNLVVENSVSANELKCFLEKVRNIVTWFHQSSIGAEELKKAQRDQNVAEGKIKHLIGDVSTRWNSQLHMVERFVVMSAIIGSILLNHPDAPPMLQANEIIVLKELITILKPFEKVSDEMSTEKYVVGSKVIPIVKCLKEYLDSIDPVHELGVQLRNSLLNEIKKRFDSIQKVHLFSMATFLDPRFKNIHLNDGAALAKTITYIKRYLYKESRDLIGESEESEHIASSSAAFDGGDIWQAHQKLIKAAASNRSENSATSELDLYIAAPLADLKNDPLQLWKSHAGAYPKLSELACKHLVIPASSAPAERLFSKAGNVLRKARSRILGKRLQKLLFLQSLPSDMW